MTPETQRPGMSMDQFNGNQFHVDQDKCIRCGECVKECPVNILVIGDTVPFVADGRSRDCIGCQHCLAVCPEGAVSVLGLRPEDSYQLDGTEMPSYLQLDRLLRGRRSVRRYLDEDVEPTVIEKLLQTAFHAPSGRNDRRLSFSVIEKREVMNRFREQTYEGLAELVKNNDLPAGYESFVDIVNGWTMYQVDVLFRWAPHLVVATVPIDSPSAEVDGIISLSHFEIAAQSLGLGTLWNGLAKMSIGLLPELKIPLKIPEQTLLAFTMSFGKPEVSYTRSVQYETLIRVID
ncbi:MAG: nitroreductase family protein [Desulfocapsaceae bacterium]